MSFKNKVVIVTGSSAGLGAVMAVAFSAEGARVVIVGRNESRLAAVASRCNDPLVVRADIGVEGDAQRVINQTIQKFGQIDVLVNNAGIVSRASLFTGDIMKAYDSIMNINLRAAIHLTSLATPHLVKTKGNIVNISSLAGKTPIFSVLMPYCASKAALNHFTVCAAAELAPYGVRVNTVSPGPAKTEILETNEAGITLKDIQKGTALDRICEPEEVADLVLFVASDKAKGITGSNYIADNGYLVKH